FGSTNSLESSSNSLSAPFKHASSSKTQDRVIRLDPLVYRKQRERNISLRSNLSEKLMKPAVLTGIRKMDKLSENISNHQILVQDVLFQSRIVTSNLEQLQKQLGKFGTENYLKEIKTGSSIADRNLVEIDIPSTNENMSTFLPLNQLRFHRTIAIPVLRSNYLFQPHKSWKVYRINIICFKDDYLTAYVLQPKKAKFKKQGRPASSNDYQQEKTVSDLETTSSSGLDPRKTRSLDTCNQENTSTTSTCQTADAIIQPEAIIQISMGTDK
ncbi:unnamed protein product, partial [Allacma fusca]